ncbi:iron complex outermembrane recepter protein [Catalinimonas alkaloidigena]|uniref:Iron complex outermembrane recepter protein n=1 Tax=Catalinimonas alkaloidigena TaxID=1075417 RepID=A0A1G9KHU5_9BACT|nr:TonB-dependent receptor [Catalinimonas alkaloidigena]SDL49182.1 iron complex outermembrane recepter protein [Catalinimonas alkaloidigena]
MKIFYLTVGFAMTSLLPPVPAEAQVQASTSLAYRIASSDEQPKQKEVSLKSLFQELEQQFGVKFIYPSEIQGQAIRYYVHRSVGLEKNLQAALQSTSLRYKKVGDDYYAIYREVEETTAEVVQPVWKDARTPVAASMSAHNTLMAIRAARAQRAVAISGRVIDATGEGIPGINILEKGTTNGTITDVNGNYTLNVGDNATLVFSAVGFATQEVVVGGRTTIDVTMADDIKALDEVVVVGYGTQRKGEITSSVASIGVEEFNKGNISNVSQLLQGKVSGLSISRPGGDPNAGFAIRLRGLSTLGANTQPLVVVDGQIGADLNTVDPNDIASIDVLKDGSAAAIYGTRGSAGVIIVTTKSGSADSFGVSYSGLVQTETPARFTQHMTADEYRQLSNAVDYGATTDWYKEITRTAFSHTHNLSLSGGNSSGTTYSASVNFRNAQGVAINTGFNQINTRLNLSQSVLDDRLVFNLNMSNTSRESQLGYSEAFKYAAIYNPTAPVHTTDPLYDLTGGGYYEANNVDYANPVAVLEQNMRDQELKRFNFNGSATFQIVDGLKFLVRYAQQTTSTFDEAYLPRTSFHSRNFLGVSGFSRGGYSWKADIENRNRLYENTLSYDGRISTIRVSAVAGYSYQDFLDKQFEVGGGNFVTDASGQDFSTALDFASGRGNINSYKTGSRLIGFFGRLNLNFNEAAFLSASLRREGATQFGENNKWGMFPAISAGVNLDRFLDLPSVSSIKLRASYGVTGALPPEPYLSLQTLAPGGANFYAGNNVYLQSYEPDKNANPDLKWERKKEFDVGLDFVIFNDRMTGTLDYYNRVTSDLIFNVTVPVPPNLVPTTWMNIGELSSNGFELALAYDVVRSSMFTWNSSFNFSTFNVKLARLDPTLAGSYVGATNLGTPGQEQTQITRAVEGQAIGLFWGYQYLGVDEGGKYQLADLNNDGKYDNNDQMVIGNGLPDFQLGWTNTFRYKNFDLNFLLRGAFGHQLINTYRAFYENPNLASSYNVVNTQYFNPDITDQQIFSSLFVENASFLEMDNATLGYQFNLEKKGWVKSLRAYLTGQNLFMITNYTGVDPEVRYADGNADDANSLAPGVDRREIWVLTRSFTLGVNATF